MSFCFELLLLAALCPAASAQTIEKIEGSPAIPLNSSLLKTEQKAAAPAAISSAPGDQKIERIRTEDSNVRIDELRVGGETQSITVQPKLNLRPYDVAPEPSGKSGPAQRDLPASATVGRSWKIFNF